MKEIEKRNKAHKEEAKRLKITPLGDGGWDDTISLEGELSGMQTAIKSELEFLESLCGVLRTNEASSMKLDNRITDCKNALKLIEEK